MGIQKHIKKEHTDKCKKCFETFEDIHKKNIHMRKAQLIDCEEYIHKPASGVSSLVRTPLANQKSGRN